MEVTLIETGDIPKPLTNEEAEIQLTQSGKAARFPPDVIQSLVYLDQQDSLDNVRLQIPKVDAIKQRNTLWYDAAWPVRTDTETVPLIRLDKHKTSTPGISGNSIKGKDSSRSYIIPAGEDFRVKRLEYHPECGLFHDYDLDFFIRMYPWDPPPKSRLAAGAYNVRYLGYLIRFPIRAGEPPLPTKDLLEHLNDLFLRYSSITSSAVRFVPKSEFPKLEKPIFSKPYEDSDIEGPPLREFSPAEQTFMKEALGVENMEFYSALWRDLRSNHLLQLYADVRILGKFDPDFMATLLGERARYKRELMKANEQIAKDAQQALRDYIYFNKFGTRKTKEKKVIDLAVAQYEKYWQAIEGNNCPHVKLAQEFRSSPNIEDKKKAYVRLRKYFEPAEEGFIKCNNCTYVIICTHVRDQYDLMIKNKTLQASRVALEPYVDKTPIFGQLFCKYCGEQLMEAEDSTGVQTYVGGIRIEQHSIDAQFKDFLWNETNRAVRGSIRFAVVVSNRAISDMVSTLVDFITPNVKEMESKLLKSKTITPSELKDKRQLFSNIYIYALLVKIVKENPKKITFTGTESGASLKTLFKTALNLLVTGKNVLINRIPDVNNELIKSYLFKAFKIINDTVSGKLREESTDVQDRFVLLFLDPFYHSIANMSALDYYKVHPQSGDNPPTMDETERILNVNVAKLAPGQDIFSEVPPLHLKKWTTYAGPPKADLKWLHNLWEEVILRGYQASFGYFQNRTFEEFTHFGGALNPKFREFYAKFDAIKTRENLHDELYAAGHLTAYNFYRAAGPKYFRPVPNMINRVYGTKNAHRHDFSILKKVANVIVDRECSIGGDLLSKPASKVVDVKAALREKRIRTNFFNFYEFRCPVQKTKSDYFHSWNSKDVCTKCGVSKSQLSNMDNSYFKKFQKMYLETIKVNPELNLAVKESPTQEPPTPPKDWKFNNAVILQFTNRASKVSGIPRDRLQRIFENLGLTEGVYFDDIESGAISPVKELDNEKAKARQVIIDAYVENMITNYETLKKRNSIKKLPAHLEDFIIRAEKKQKLNFSKLQPWPTEYPLLVDWMRRQYIKSPDLNIILSNYMLEYLYSNLMRIEKMNDTGKAIFEWSVKQLIDQDRSYAMLRAKEEVRLLVGQRPNLEFASEAPLEYATDEETPEVTDVDDPFSLDEMDYEGENEIGN